MNEIDQLIQRYLDGQMSAEDRMHLSRLVVEDATIRARLRAAAELHGLLLMLADARAAQLPDADNLSVFPMAYTPPAKSTTQPHRIRLPRWVGAIAACLALLAAGAWYYVRDIPPANAVARLTNDNPVDWAEQKRPDRNGWLTRGKYELRAGTARLQTEAGAIVSIAAPAEFELIEPGIMRLNTGKLLARMLGTDSKLRVFANGMNVEDLGTAFGINTAAKGPSLVSVLDGKIALHTTFPKPASEVVTAGNTMLVSRENDTEPVTRVKFDRSTFEDLWPLTLGVDAVSSLVRFLPPGPYNDPMTEFRSDSRLFIMPERQNVILAAPLRIEGRSSTREAIEFSQSPVYIPTGSRVDSYLLFFNPANASIEHPVSLSGEITFNRPIIGLIYWGDRLLYSSDEVVGIPGLNYRFNDRRGLEPLPDDKPAQDIVEVSADKRSLFFNFHVSNGRDQLRVILAADGGYSAASRPFGSGPGR